MTKLIVALDLKTVEDAKKVIDELTPEVEYFKVGSILFAQEGPAIVKYIKDKGAKVFLDLKFFDIPNTVHGVSFAAAQLEVDMFTIHLLGGGEMIRKAQDGVFDYQRLYIESSGKAPLVLGVTVLTSISEEILNKDLRIDMSMRDMVMHLVQLGYDHGLRGYVCSPHEIEMLKSKFSDLILVTPGIRLPGDKAGDQKRIMTPKEAAQRGADYIVMGRSVYMAQDKKAVVNQVLEDLGSV